MDLSERGGRLAVEVKLDSRYYSGVGQALALRELYGRYAVVLHILDRIDPRVERALHKVAASAKIKIILIGRSSKTIKVIT